MNMNIYYCIGEQTLYSVFYLPYYYFDDKQTLYGCWILKI